MAFCFKKKESVQKAIRRLGCERVEDALECLKDCRHGEAIHCARKDIKKMRAVLRLVRAEINRKEFRRLTKLLREPAKRLGAPRDAYVKAKTLTDLMRHYKGQLTPGALRHIRGELRTQLNDEMKRFAQERATKAIERGLRRVAREFKDLKIKSKGWNALNPGFKSAYADGGCAYKMACKDSSPENFHEWRKRAKELWYQVTLLRRVWPEQIEAIAGELELLGEHLGDDHDLVMLREAIQKMCAGEKYPRELETLNGLIEERQRQLRAAALAIGARFYAEKPSAFCKRLAGYWKIWCKEKKSARLAEATS